MISEGIRPSDMILSDHIPDTQTEYTKLFF